MSLSFINNFKPYDFPKYGYIKIPKVKIPAEDYIKYNLPNNCSSEQYLYSLMMFGFNEKLNNGKILKDKKDIYLKRLEFEFKEITKLLFTDYILLVNNIIRFCKKNDILNSPGRGSGPGSLILYILDIVSVDAIKHDLLFERFISSDRTEVREFDGEKYISSKEVPDVDIDSDRSKKHLINEFLAKEFNGKTAAIKTFGTLQGKSIVKEVLKIYENFNEEEAKEVSDLIDVNFGKVQEVSDALINNLKFKTWAENYKDAALIACKLTGLLKSNGVHASGIIICNDKLEDCMPLELAKSSDKDEKVLVSSFDMNSAQAIGIKVDNLGLKNLEAIRECLTLINKNLEDININDKTIYNFINNTINYRGLFQAEEGLGKTVLQKIKPNNIEDVSLSVAIGRPGSLNFLDEILEGRASGNKRKLDKRIEDILSSTYNVIVYQEQIMALSRKMADFSAIESNSLRKGISKKQKEKVLEFKDKFITNSIKNGYGEDFAKDIFNTFEKSGDYLFNRCLSPDTVVATKYEKKKMSAIKSGDKIKAFDIVKKEDFYVKVINIYKNRQPLFKVYWSNGSITKSSLEHKFLSSSCEMLELAKILTHNFLLKDNIHFTKIKYLGIKDTLDFEVDSPFHNFYANDIVVSNSHSTAYSYLTAICAYLKANYPTEFFYSILKNAKNESKPLEEIAAIFEELPHFGIELLPPSLLKSDIDFTLEGDKKIRMGLGNVKGVAQKAIDKLRGFKHEYSNKFELFQSAEECGLNIGVTSALVQSGAMDDFFSKSRSRMVLELQLYKLLTPKERKRVIELGPKFNYDLYEIMIYLTGKNNTEKDYKPFIKPSRLETIRQKYDLYKQIYHQNSKNENLANYFFERNYIGFSYSQNLFKILQKEHPDLISIQQLQGELSDDRMKHIFGGEVVDVIYGVARNAKKTKYLKLKIQDTSGAIDCMLFNDYISISEELNGQKFEVGNIVVCRGRKKSDAIFCDSIAIQENKIYKKLAELKNNN